MKKILIVYNGKILNAPRPRRMIECLEDEYNITVLCREDKKNPYDQEFQSIDFIEHNFGVFTKLEKMSKIFLNQFSLFEKSIEDKNQDNIIGKLKKLKFDYIICHNLQLLPLVLKIKNNAKVIFDAREYFPKHFEDRFLWKIAYQRLNKYLTLKYMPKCDFIITVSDGIKEQYKKDLKLDTIEVIESFPNYWNLKPSDTNEKIKIIHHGNATKSRKIEDMIYMMDNVDDRYTFDLMLVPSDKKYYNFLKKLVEERKNINLIEPVSYKQIIPFINKYDIGIYNLKPNSFNMEYALPNKFFEFIQARLAVIIGPSIEMMKFIDEYNFGSYPVDFDNKKMAKLLNSLTRDDINKMKLNADETANILRKEKACLKMKEIIVNL